MAILFFINFGYFGILYPILLGFSVIRRSGRYLYFFIGCTPIIAARCLLDYRTVGKIAWAGPDSGGGSAFDHDGAFYATSVLAVYAIAALLLTWRFVRRFDEFVDRPRALPDGGSVRPLGAINRAGTGIPWS